MIDLAIIIVTWNVRDLALDAIATLHADLAPSGLRTRTIVVDSASSDDTVAAVRDAFPDVTLIASAENIGFAAANNLALRQLGFGDARVPDADLPRAVYLLNPDTRTHDGATRALYDALLADARLGLVGARLSYGDGSFQHSAFGFPGLRQLWVEFFPTPGRWIEGRFNGRYPRALYAGGAPFAVDAVLGATMMLKREVIQQTGLFDEGFFMYCEEIDWAWRIRRAGWSIACVPTAHVTHLGGQSTGQRSPASARNLWESRLRLYAKHHPTWKQRIARQLIAIGIRRKRAQTDDPALHAAYEAILGAARSA